MMANGIVVVPQRLASPLFPVKIDEMEDSSSNIDKSGGGGENKEKKSRP
jgi:hypothetical protein